MRYLRYTFEVNPENKDIWLAYLSELPFDTFDDNSSDELIAWCIQSQENQELIDRGLKTLKEQGLVILAFEEEPQVNWNQVWESNYPPVSIDYRLRIRAPFHPPDSGYELELVIEPHMSFGTGHHPTTLGILRRMLEMEWDGKVVLDMGSGTGILAIYVKKKGAREVVAIDHEEWAFLNARENASRNNVALVALQGSFESIEGEYDVILANINQNIILQGLVKMIGHLKQGGILICSGYYPEGHDRIAEQGIKQGIVVDAFYTEGIWAVSVFHKP
ncbi:MAG: 50S ribosomal protein L11 methyltransferase [Sphingomonadales bacterium]|nr:50S ribosomal protein L11 methyltransferase [Sphingomonadales bacterium]